MTAVGPGPETFRKLASEYAVVPVWRDLAGDLHTPVGLYAALCAAPVDTSAALCAAPVDTSAALSDASADTSAALCAPEADTGAAPADGVGSVLLEGVEGGEQWGRYAVLALDPLTILTSRDGVLSWSDGPPCPLPPGTEASDGLAGTLRAVLDRLRAPDLPELEPCGLTAVAVLGGDAFRAGPRATRPADDDLSALEAVVVFPRTLVIMDHLRQRLRLVSLVVVDEDRLPEEQYAEALERLDALTARVAAASPVGPLGLPAEPEAVTVEPDIPDDVYATLLDRAHEHVLAGEVDQLSVSRRYLVRGPADPLAVYRLLRMTNPSPTLYLARLPGVALVGSSPQKLVTVRGRRVSTRAIGGTRPRGDSPGADAALEAELLADPKELAEHDMLVDAAMADLAPLARPGSLRVVGRHQVVRLSAVMHLATEVTADLADDRHPLDAVDAVFPAGTVCGVPREAALRLIDTIEPHRRGLYGGAVGFLGLSGAVDLSLGIRTLHLTSDLAAVQAGAAVVADSHIPSEVRESATKSRALTEALALSRRLAD